MLTEIMMNQLPIGTLIETDDLVGLFVGDGMLAVLNSDIFEEGSIMYLTERGPNDWVIVDKNKGYYWGWWISRDWNGKISTRELNASNYDDDEYDWDWDFTLHEYLDRYQDYDY